MKSNEPKDKPVTRRQLLASMGAAGALIAAGAGLPFEAHAAKVTVPAADNKSWLNVKDFGALGNGYDDDAPFIQSAIDAAAADKGGAVFFPSGKYYINRGLLMRNKVSLIGAGAENTFIKAGNADMFMLYSGSGINNYSVEGITLEGVGPSGATGDIVERGIYAVEGANITLRNCMFTGVANGIRLVRAQHVIISNCTFIKVFGSQSQAEGYGIVVEGGANHTIQGNHFKNVSKHCVHLTMGSVYSHVTGNVMEYSEDAAIMVSSKVTACSNHLIEGNIVAPYAVTDQEHSSTYGIRLKDACSYNTVVNNVISRAASAGIQLEAGENAGDDRPYGNSIAGNSIYGSVRGIAILNADANSVKNNDVRRTEYGILLDTVGEGSSSSTKRNIVTSNSIYQSSAAAVRVGSASCEANIVFGNAGHDNAEGLKDSGTNTATAGF
ncbi:right-handed parallel beta-helix repeat-containing protein [Paenibacillus sp. UNC451MF]|uniref:right-handed parallel beta-helix repeat-containing protein n=1 Tax=Paenibacillus sp. UNC451MF TaxID=1449063 RepID=UPI000491526D|nr:right-handed parallel beta-helix repeat-containing protein [Paenibacillus sp. UNC451MF]